ncbi:MAG: TVP38/TMEM64 family protein [Clostridia bacterium]|nr:TVP38/TMEM64 family protein [Clostridia bacterium]
MDNQTTNKRKSFLGICLILFSIAFLFALSFLIGNPLLQFVNDPEQFRLWVQSHGIWSYLAFIGIVIVQVIVAFIPGEPFEIAAGYAFGAWQGTLLCMIATTLGSMLVFLLVRKFGIKLVQIFFSLEKLNNLKFLKDSQRRDLLFLIIYMIPGTPKDLLSYFAGLTNISFIPFLLISFFGRIPSIITSTIGGDMLMKQNYWFAGITFGIALLISAVGIYIYNRICQKHNQEEHHERETL